MLKTLKKSLNVRVEIIKITPLSLICIVDFLCCFLLSIVICIVLTCFNYCSFHFFSFDSDSFSLENLKLVCFTMHAIAQTRSQWLQFSHCLKVLIDTLPWLFITTWPPFDLQQHISFMQTNKTVLKTLILSLVVQFL